MWRALLALGAVLAVAAFLSLPPRPSPTGDSPTIRNTSLPEASPVCPWRDPQPDLLRLFPAASNHVVETRILSGAMAQLQRRLGRAMTADENPLHIYRALNTAGDVIGSVLVCRVKGAHGGIEIVTGVEKDGAVQGVRIQSQREPDSVARVITSSNFLASFSGKNASSPLRLKDDLPDVPSNARASAQAIADGVRSQLIVLSFAETPEPAHHSSTSIRH